MGSQRGLEHSAGPDLSDISEEDAAVLTAAYGTWWREWLGPMTPEHRGAGLALLLEQATWTEGERAQWAKGCQAVSRPLRWDLPGYLSVSTLIVWAERAAARMAGNGF